MELRGKKVLVVGLGKSGLAAALFLRRQGALVTVSDVRTAESLGRDIPALLDAGITVEAGGHGHSTFWRQDLIVVSPGVPLATPELAEVRPFRIPVIGELELAARFLHAQVLAITGSNGKTTTTTLCGEVLRAGGLPAMVGGNIGVPVIELAERPENRPDAWAVLEVSSFQLETTVEFRPRIALILNITPDHLDRHGTFENYAAAKERIFANQAADDFLVLNGDDPRAQQAAARARSQVYWFSRTKLVRRGACVVNGIVAFRDSEQGSFEPVMPVSGIPLKGSHNVENVLAAVCAGKLAGVQPEAIRQAVESFRAVEHRLEYVATVDGVEYYNDSKATNVDSAMKAIESFPGPIHLILGGKDKNSDYTLLRELLKARVKTVYTIGAAAEKIEAHLAGSVTIARAGTLEKAVEKAREAARAGEVVLLAPACSSFDQFENYEQRGRVFKELVASLASKNREAAHAWQSA
jgi:UDP-N-acetylmuramoylalanine--D-glutamate ligase